MNEEVAELLTDHQEPRPSVRPGPIAIGLIAVAACAAVNGASASAAGLRVTTGSELFGVTCVSARDCWAVGGRMAGAKVVTLIEHWNGSGWSASRSGNPSGSTRATLDAVSCARASACWAVGSYAHSGKTLALVERWNGAKWTLATAARPPASVDVTLAAVSCPAVRTCMAVGINGLLTLAERWNGTRWLLSGSISRGTQESLLGAVSCASTTSCWAGGTWLSTSTSGTLTEHWNGHKWALTHTGTSAVAGAALNGIACRRSFCMAVGNRNARALAQHLAGGKWTVAYPPTPAGGTSARLAGVSCATTSACMGIGDFTMSSNPHALAERWNGSMWSVVAAPSPSSQTQLAAVACTSVGNCWAVGFTGATFAKLIEHWTSGKWVVVH